MATQSVSGSERAWAGRVSRRRVEAEKARVLVVDDDPSLRKTLADILGARGFEAVTAGTGTEAIVDLESETFSVALIDLRLPDMRGLEVVERISAVSPLTEAIILTAHASVDTASEATRKGAFSYLVKPYRMDDLLRDVEHAVERRRARREILRLASYPQLDPSPIIEVDPTGAVTYVNPAAERLFPELDGEGRSPLLEGIENLFAELCTGSPKELVREVRLVDATYEQHISYVPASGLVRMHVRDITKRKRAEAALATRVREQAAVAELGNRALAGLPLPDVYDKAAGLIAETMGVALCAILESRPGTDALLLRAGVGWDPSLYGAALVEAGSGTWAEFTLSSEEPVTLGDLRDERRFSIPSLLAERGVVRGLSLAFGARGSALGVVGVFETSRRELGTEDGHFLRAMANVLAAGVQRHRAEVEVHLLATTDSLTGIANRWEFTRILRTEIDRAARYGVALSVIMCDLDHFKRVNDTFGHAVGDDVLVAIAELTRRNLRSVDVVARWGGEEFMILLPSSDLAAARLVAEKLRLSIATHQFERVGHLTASFGASSYRTGDDLNTLAKRADDALYRAKEQGRNCVQSDFDILADGPRRLVVRDGGGGKSDDVLQDGTTGD